LELLFFCFSCFFVSEGFPVWSKLELDVNSTLGTTLHATTGMPLLLRFFSTFQLPWIQLFSNYSNQVEAIGTVEADKPRPHLKKV
jgi:hypothetical protein